MISFALRSDKILGLSESHVLLMRRTLNPSLTRYLSFFLAANRLSLPHREVESTSIIVFKPGTRKSQTYGPIGNWKSNSTCNPDRIDINSDSCGHGFLLKTSAKLRDIFSRMFRFLAGFLRFMRRLWASAHLDVSFLRPHAQCSEPLWALKCLASTIPRSLSLNRFASFWKQSRLHPHSFERDKRERLFFQCSSEIIDLNRIPKCFSMLSIAVTEAVYG